MEEIYKEKYFKLLEENQLLKNELKELKLQLNLSIKTI